MKSLICTGGIALAFALASVTGAEAQKKMTYQEAFAKCKQEIGAGATANDKAEHCGALRRRRRLHAQVRISPEEEGEDLTSEAAFHRALQCAPTHL